MLFIRDSGHFDHLHVSEFTAHNNSWLEFQGHLYESLASIELNSMKAALGAYLVADCP